MMIQHQIVKILSAACILLVPIILSKSEYSGRNQEQDDTAKVSSLVGYFENFARDLKSSKELFNARGHNESTASIVNSVYRVGNQESIMQHQRDQNNKLANDEKIADLCEQRKLVALSNTKMDSLKSLTSLVYELRELLHNQRKESENLIEQLENAWSSRQESEVRRQRLKENFEEANGAVNALLTEIDHVKHSNENEIQNRDKLIFSLLSMSSNAKNKLKEKELSVLKEELHQYGDQLTETKRSLSLFD